MKTITATNRGIIINYEDTKKSSFISYEPLVQQTTNTQKINKPRFYEMNDLQKSMYRRLLYGLTAYSQEEILTMSPSVIFNINKDHHRAKELLNILKYDLVYGHYNKFLSVIFPKINFSYYKDGQDVSLPTLKELKISTLDVVDCWVKGKLLPLNFYNLNLSILKI